MESQRRAFSSKFMSWLCPKNNLSNFFSFFGNFFCRQSWKLHVKSSVFSLLFKKLNLHSPFLTSSIGPNNILLCFLSSLRDAEVVWVHKKIQNLRGWVSQHVVGEVSFRYLYVLGHFSTTNKSRIAWQIAQKGLRSLYLVTKCVCQCRKRWKKEKFFFSILSRF